MAPRVKRSSRVSTEAWKCDRLGINTKDRWSFSVFGDSWQDAQIYITVIEKANSSNGRFFARTLKCQNLILGQTNYYLNWMKNYLNLLTKIWKVMMICIHSNNNNKNNYNENK